MAAYEKAPSGTDHDPIIAIDGFFLIDYPFSSLANYLRSLLREWQKLEQPPRILLLIPRLPPEIDDSVLKASNVRLVMPDHPCRPSSRFIALIKWHQWNIPRLLRKHRPDLYFSPFHFTPLFTWGVPAVTTVHDLCFLAEPKFSIGSLTHRIQVISACLVAGRLICVSNYTSAILHRWWKSSGEKSAIVQNGYDGTCISEETAKRLLATECAGVIPGHYFIWIGHPSPRKNIEGLMDSFALYQRERADERRLVLVAPEHSHVGLHALAGERGIDDSLVLLNGIGNEIRDALYRCATALVFPSHCEGFGYPVLEAMVQGCPPISFRHGPSREIVGSTFPLAETLEPTGFAKLMIHAAELNPAEREETAENLMRRAAGFSTRTMAEKTLEILLKAV
jgi:glycosyltransferase involved in cell wall biosynthesis